jgi:hypothetical protein
LLWALDALALQGEFAAPAVSDLERWFSAALAGARGRARVFLDVWDLGAADRARFERMNCEQRA